MTFSLTRPPSREGHISIQGHDDDHLPLALHASLSSLVPGSSAHPDYHHDMMKEKDRAGIDIVVDSDCLSLQGSGVDVEPVLLKGHIVLHLTEPTSIKEITLQFRGKAKLPLPPSETLTLSTSPQWFTICNHEWSFLEGEKRHGHTLKAGFHQFPFQLQLGGALPSSITSDLHGGAHVSYKLRAAAVRPGLVHNMQTVIPISIVRTFGPQALEYQQSLEIENTWPEKLMYSIMIPHKAWAAGDELTAIVKFSPLSKGVRILTVTTTVHETTKLYCRGGVQEHTRCVITVNHDILDGNVERHGSTRGSQFAFPVTRMSSEDRVRNVAQLDPTHQQATSSHESHSAAAPPPSSNDQPSSFETPSTFAEEEGVLMSQDDLVAHLTLFIPKSVTPSHILEPISVFHRIRWSILMSNLDGHTSELRCSLPLHILDSRLLDEARTNSAATRRLLLDGLEAPIDEEQDAELPSYSAHVRDRVANMYLPDAATTRMLNPWVYSNVSPTFMPEHQSLSGAWSPPGAASPLIPHPVSSHLPHVPQSGTSMPLEWVNSELLHSLSNIAPPRPRTSTSQHSYSPDPVTRPDSESASRRGSRASSPEQHLSMMTINPLPAPLISTTHETFVHNGHASRSLPELFNIQLKPHTSLSSPGWRISRSGSHSNLASLAEAHRALMQSHHPPRQQSIPTPVIASTESIPESDLWHRTFTEVPDYEVASRGFIGGVTPLSSMRGLPSYDEAERNASAASDTHEEDGALTIRTARQEPVA